ncbi:hypothetical protein BVC80_1815g42 [Macleaya cordata]|uniref:PDZ domain n=1 Tax=Macleaya cordata TaxID=56857 RepID=A0A200QVY9_MACCD|nr:hypothetical protein BVC80_1815g42 [Macleaya cordata]
MSLSRSYIINANSFYEEFDKYLYPTMYLNIDAKRAALKASASVVSVVSLSDCEDVNGTYVSTILTSASLLRPFTELDINDIKIDVQLSDGRLFDGQIYTYDFHYNIAAIKVESDALLPIANLRILDDSIRIDPNESYSFNLCPGEMVVALGRYFEKPNDLMVAPGTLRRFCRPWLGMVMTNLYAASVGKLEKIIQKFPKIFKGVIVEKVIQGSPADRAGLLRHDVIVQCNENSVQNFFGGTLP